MTPCCATLPAPHQRQVNVTLPGHHLIAGGGLVSAQVDRDDLEMKLGVGRGMNPWEKHP